MILIVGADGSMGKRYQAILKHLGHLYVRSEAKWADQPRDHIPRNVHGIIIATPTQTHAEMIREYLPYGKPILCEKPVTKNISALKELLDEVKKSHTPFRMTHQYRHLVKSSQEVGDSSYDYFRHGNDGLVWDCMQIIALARGHVELAEKSPIWRCSINGSELSLDDMDWAYVEEVKQWLATPGDDLGAILAAHEKVEEYRKTHV